ncbi:RNA-binding cell elongation regulator Jag/EloR [uncultured Megasphaera sp.]|uniref:RNA-binding cell elongation regulator Jag/EloR n=1 Tax=uncultured Megasphaera sp. TaxID=165188 RepID=UPI002868FDC3|nr:RNA-binding cell elongation regulator Jag/EloR [uncultured Megasphaera sp.]
MSTIETTGKTIEDAVRSGLVRLGRMKEEVDIEVLEEPKSGFFGFGSKPAKVRITEKEGLPSVPTVDDIKAPLEAAAKTEEMAVPAKEAALPEVKEAAAEAVPAAAEPVSGESDESEAESFTAEEAAVKAKAFLQEVLKNMGIDVVIEKMIKSDKVLLHLHGKNLGILIGKHGQTLDALQYLTNLTTNQGQSTRHFIMLDVENYRHRREETLKQLAIRLANRVKKNGDRVVLEPMNGYERKIIHVTLQNDPQVRTESEGQDPYRHVVIYYQE